MTACLVCGTDTRRRRRLRDRVAAGDPPLNGIEWVEVDADGDGVTITIGFTLKAPEIGRGNVRITGAPGALPVTVEWVDSCGGDDVDLDRCVRVGLDRAGGFATYTLCIVEPGPRGAPGPTPLAGFDPRSSCISFSFKTDCDDGLDCAASDVCPPATHDEPEISYLAKDYASFRQLILDRLALVMPDWTERHVPDLELTLVELLAWVGDQLSYAQDAVATEAYLDTARLRMSVRRHLRLIDYQLHEGCNARAWVAIETTDAQTLEPGQVRFTTAPAATGLIGPALREEEVEGILRDVQVFEPVVARPLRLVPAHSTIRFWAWGEERCCLPAGALRATLRDAWVDEPTPVKRPARTADRATRETATADEGDPATGRRRALDLQPGDVLIFEEALGSTTGCPPDADPGHRHAVRLTSVKASVDPAFDQPVVEIAWSVEDALPFDLCISAVGGECCEAFEPAVAHGNVVLVDHGRTVCWCGDCPTIPVDPPVEVPGPCVDLACTCGHERGESVLVATPLRWRIEDQPAEPITFAEAFPRPPDVARTQARRLEELVPAVERWLQALWERVRDGEALAASDLADLRRIFGARAVAEAGLPAKDDAEGRAAMARLFAVKDRRLGPKADRVDRLARRVRAGYRLDDTDVRELAHAWGSAFAGGLDVRDAAADGAAASAMERDPREALPAVRVTDKDGRTWTTRLDLLDSAATDRHVAVEIDDDGLATLRFGDGRLGAAPEPGIDLRVRHRVTGGRAGNVGSGAIARLVTCRTEATGIARVWNPLPASGGADRESVDEARMFGPPSIRTAARAIVDRDYATLAGRHRHVQRAGAALRWTGSWYEVAVAIDEAAAGQPEPSLLAGIGDEIEAVRRVGHDVAVRAATSVPLLIRLGVCVRPTHHQSDVRKALLRAFGTGLGADGRPAFFHPDRLTFGTHIETSRIVTTALDIAGVESITVDRLERLFVGPAGEVEAGILRIGDLEVARLDNDPRYPDNGRLELDLRGGA